MDPRQELFLQKRFALAGSTFAQVSAFFVIEKSLDCFLNRDLWRVPRDTRRIHITGLRLSAFPASRLGRDVDEFAVVEIPVNPLRAAASAVIAVQLLARRVMTGIDASIGPPNQACRAASAGGTVRPLYDFAQMTFKLRVLSLLNGGASRDRNSSAY